MLTHHDPTILGNIPGDWEIRALWDLVERDQSRSGDWGDNFGEKGLGVLRSTNFTNDGHTDLSDVEKRYFAKSKVELLSLRSGDILLERSGGGPDQPVGRVVLIENDMPGFGFGNFVYRLRPQTSLVSPSFLRWVLHELHRSGVIERVQYQTTQMRNLDWRDYRRLLLPYPDLQEQKRIASLIDTADKLIHASKKLLGIRGSLHRDDMRGPLNILKTSLLQQLLTGRRRVPKSAT